jgi:hypothetical protein
VGGGWVYNNTINNNDNNAINGNNNTIYYNTINGDTVHVNSSRGWAYVRVSNNVLNNNV